MTEVVLDASVVLDWFHGDRSSTAAVRVEVAGGRLVAVVPSLMFLEVLNVAGRRWGWDSAALVRLAMDLKSLGLETTEPPLEAVAGWTGRGLTAYDGTYVALAESLGIRLLTLDDQVLRMAPGLAISPSALGPDI